MQVLPTIPAGIATPALLVVANVFMTYAWYGHLRDARSASLWGVVFMSWGVAFFEYCLQVPANRIGHQQAGYSLAQLKVMQEVITMAVFAVFAYFVMRERLGVNFIYASICLIGAAYFMFKDFKPAT